MQGEKQAHHLWTKDEIRMLYTIWNEHSVEEVSTMLGIDKAKISYMATLMRKQGFPLQKKRVTGKTDLMLKELKSELNIQ